MLYLIKAVLNRDDLSINRYNSVTIEDISQNPLDEDSKKEFDKPVIKLLC